MKHKLFLFVTLLAALAVPHSAQTQDACPGWHNPASFSFYNYTGRLGQVNSSQQTGGYPQIAWTGSMYTGQQLASLTTPNGCSNSALPSPNKLFLIMDTNTLAPGAADSLRNRDPNTGYRLPFVPNQQYPNLTRSIRIGDGCPGNDNTSATSLSYNFTVTPSNAVMYLYYAIVAEVSGHGVECDPMFRISVEKQSTDGSWQLISDTLEYVISTTPIAGQGINVTGTPGNHVFFQPSYEDNGWHLVGGTGDTAVIYKDWSVATINLGNHFYEYLRINVSISDCCQGTHYAYAYVCGDYDPLYISYDPASSRLSAPQGMDNYKWYVSEFGVSENLADLLPSGTNEHFTYRFLDEGSEASGHAEYTVQPSNFQVLYRNQPDHSIIVPVQDSIGLRQTFRCKITSALDPDKPYYTYLYANVDNPGFFEVTDGDFIFSDTAKTRLKKYIGNGGDVVIPSTVIIIEDSAFFRQSSITSVIIPYGVTQICNLAFWYCTGMTSITIPNSVQKIGVGAFCECRNLTTIDIPNSVTSIGSTAFAQCTSLESIVIPNSVVSLGDWLFGGCENLTHVTLSNSITSLEYLTFYNCYSLKSISIPNSVTHINNQAFMGCTSLDSIIIPSSVSQIDNAAFSFCSGLTSIVVDEDNPVYDSRNGCNAIIETNTNTMILGCQTTIIPNTVTTIGPYAYRGCSNMTSIDIPNSVNSIGVEAFSTCNGLTEVILPNSITSISFGTFMYSEGLTTVVIPSSVNSISYNAFIYCPKLSTVYCYAETPPSLFDFDNPFYPNNPNIYVPCNAVSSYKNATKWSDYDSLIHGMIDVDFSYNFVANNDIFGTINVSVVDCDSNVTVTAMAIDGYVFTGWSDGDSNATRTIHLTSDTTLTAFFDTIQAIEIIDGDFIFSDVAKTRLKKYIGTSDTVVIPSTVTVIEDSAFYEKTSLTSVEIPSSVLFIGQKEFVGCYNLHLYFRGTTPPEFNDYLFYAVFVHIPCEAYNAYENNNNWRQYVNRTYLRSDFTYSFFSNNTAFGTVQVSEVDCPSNNVTVTATANVGYFFAGWSDDSMDNPHTIHLTSDTALTAFFEEAVEYYHVNAWADTDEHGWVEVDNNEVTYGEFTTLQAYANPGYRFTGWSDGSTDNPYTISVISDTVLTAMFAPCTITADDLPYFEGFETTPASTYNTPGVVPDCWTAYTNGTNATYTPHVVNGIMYASYRKSGENSLVMISGSETYGSDKYVLLPPTAIPLHDLYLNFWMCTEGSTQGVLTVGYVTSSDTTTFTPIQSYPASTETVHSGNGIQNGHGMNVELSLATASDEATQLAFRWEYGTSYYSCCIDDIILSYPPSCPKVEYLAATGITSESAIVSWHEVGSAAQWQVTIISGEDTSTSIESSTIYALSNLQPNTEYTVEVSPVCYYDTSNVRRIIFRTECAIISSLPWTEDFENITDDSYPMPYCWGRYQSAKTTSYDYPYCPNSTSAARRGSHYLVFSNGTTVAYPDTMVAILPAVDTSVYPMSDNRVTFWAKMGNNNYSKSVYVGTVSDPNDMNTFTLMDSVLVSGDEYTKYIVPLTVTTDARVALMVTKGNGSLYIDDLTLEEQPTCPDMRGLYFDIPTLSSVTVSWRDDGAGGYEVELRQDSIVVNSLTIDTATVTFYELELDNDYQVYVRAICDTNHGEWSDALNIHFGYCEPAPTSRDAQGITAVAFGGMVNDSIHPQAAPFYGNYTSMQGSVAAGTTAQVNITYFTGYTYGTVIWVDWDQSLTFEENEIVYFGESANAKPTTLAASFYIPMTQNTGSYRMRIAGADSKFDNYINNGGVAPDPCFTSSYAAAEDYTLVVTEAVSCPDIVSVSVDEVTSDSVTISWVDEYPGTRNYTIYNMNDSLVVATDVIGDTYQITGLTGNTVYTFGVQASCSDDEVTNIVITSVRTECGIISSLPWTEDFETVPDGNYQMPYCWERYQSAKTTSYDYPYSMNSPNFTHNGSRILVFGNGTSSAYPDTMVAILPAVDTTVYPMNGNRVSFWARMANNGYSRNVYVGTMSNPADINTFNLIDSVLISEWEYTKYTIPLTNANDAHVALMVLKYNSSLFVDDLTLEKIPSCLDVTNLTLEEATTSSVTLSWRDTMNSGASYTIYNMNDNTEIGTYPLLAPLDWGLASYTVTGLEPNTHYSFGVQANCSDDESSPMTIIDVRTACDIIRNLPWTEDFDEIPSGSNPMPYCWQRYTSGASNNNYPSITSDGTLCFYGSTSASYPDTMVAILPEVDINTYPMNGNRVTFWAKMGNNNYEKNVYVGTVSDPADMGTFTLLNSVLVSGTEYVKHTVLLTGATDAYVVLVVKRGNGVLYIDDITLEEQPDCSDVRGLALNSQTASSATMSWRDDGAGGYELELRQDSLIIDSLTVADTTATFTGLELDNDYQVYARAVCDNNQGEWSDALNIHIGYCEPNPTSRDAQGITAVAFGGMVNDSIHPQAAPYYGDYTAMLGSVSAGTTTQVDITYYTGYTYGTVIWVDWNHSMSFEADEIVYAGESTNAKPTTLTATFHIPATQDTGSYRMRIAGADSRFDNYIQNGGTAPSPCFSSTYAVAEDYTLEVTPVVTYDTVEMVACDSLKYNGVTYTESGVYIHENNSISVTVLLATVMQGVAVETTVSAVDSYQWDDDVYTESGVYTHSYMGSNGCDSTVTLNLTIMRYYNVTAMVNDARLGSVMGGGNYWYGDTATIYALPNAGSAFNGWDNGSTTNPLRFAVTDDITIIANFTDAGTTQPDTVFVYVHDTVTQTEYVEVPVHDTTVVTEYIEVPVYDTTVVTEYVEVPVHDTTVVTEYIEVPVHDTTVITEYVEVPVHDTTVVVQVDTLVMTDTVTLTEYVPVHDTTYVDVFVHDTTTIVDTVTLTEYVSVHDTTYINVHDTTYVDVFVHDTTTVVDTVTLTEYVPVHDTTYVDVVVHDTTTVIDTVTLTEYVPVHDTTNVDVHDTTYVDVFVHDTTTIVDTITLTEYVPVHDTTYVDVVVHDTTTVVDTVTLTEYVPVHDTTYVDVVVHDTTTVVDTVTLTEYVPVHDTTYVNVHDTTYVDVFVHDTTTVVDTVTLTEYVPVHDTTYVDVFVHDTTTIFDTVTLTEYVPVHDTTYINVHDTTYVDVFVHDTTTVVDTVTLTEYVPVHDTTYIDVFVHDTTTIVDTITLTEYVPVHDTTYVNLHDTTYVNVHDTTYVNVFVHDTTTVVDTVTLTEYVPVHDTTYVDVHDTTYVDVFVHDTTVIVDTVTLTEYVPVHDTTYVDVLVHDTTTVIDTVTLTEYVPVHDTTYVDVHDTTYVDVFVHDTTTVVDTVTLTEYVPVHDTTTIIDTVTLTEYVPVHDTTYVDVHDTTYIDVFVHDTTYVDVFVHDTTTIVDTVTLTEYVPVHDTTYVDVHDTTYVDVFVHDTTTVIDTVTLTEYVPVHDTTYVDVHDTTYIDVFVHDTTYVDVFVHDTTTVVDTVTLTEYVPVHDTTYVDVHDTTYVDVFVHDTTTVVDTITLTEYVPVHDTTYVDVHDTTYIDVFVHDTTTIIDTVTLTEYVPVHDTTYVDVHDTTYVDVFVHDTTTLVDTVTLTEYVPVHDTAYVTLIDTVINTVFDTVINTVFDTVDNYIYDTTMVVDTLWLTEYDTIWITDTVIVHDTVYVTQEGIETVATAGIRLYQRDGMIVVENCDGDLLPEVVVYDAVGRRIALSTTDKQVPGIAGKAVCVPVPVSGVYLVKVGDLPARRVVVIR